MWRLIRIISSDKVPQICRAPPTPTPHNNTALNKEMHLKYVIHYININYAIPTDHIMQEQYIPIQQLDHQVYSLNHFLFYYILKS